jgi:hypothetical protein
VFVDPGEVHVLSAILSWPQCEPAHESAPDELDEGDHAPFDMAIRVDEATVVAMTSKASLVPCFLSQLVASCLLLPGRKGSSSKLSLALPDDMGGESCSRISPGRGELVRDMAAVVFSRARSQGEHFICPRCSPKGAARILS